MEKQTKEEMEAAYQRIDRLIGKTFREAKEAGANGWEMVIFSLVMQKMSASRCRGINESLMDILAAHADEICDAYARQIKNKVNDN